MSVRYIGSKARVAETIVELAGDTDGRFVDAFCGSGAVGAEASRRGWPVLLNDSMPSAVAMATGAVVRAQDVPFVRLGGYAQACATLNRLPGAAGFVHDQYSPASLRVAGTERRYFTTANAACLDAMRREIGAWAHEGLLTVVERQLLLADLMQAANRVANISGTYGCFLSRWSPSALRPVRLHVRALPPGTSSFQAVVGDVFDLETNETDVVYFDPPYTKRQYAAYYHVLETLTAGDEPEVDGVTGLRPWRDKASDFCYKSRAFDALTRLVTQTRARRILLSYSNEGHVDRDRLVAALIEVGPVRIHEVKTIGRYRPNVAAGAAGDSVNEYVIEVAPVHVTDGPREPEPEVVYA